MGIEISQIEQNSRFGRQILQKFLNFEFREKQVEVVDAPLDSRRSTSGTSLWIFRYSNFSKKSNRKERIRWRDLGLGVFGDLLQSLVDISLTMEVSSLM